MSSGDLTAREAAVLRHIGRYQLTFAEILRRLVLAGADPKRTLTELTEKQLIGSRKGYGGNRTAYVLTRRGSIRAGFNEGRAGSDGQLAEARNLALLGFCCLCGRARVRLNADELHAALGVEVTAERSHCLEWGTRQKRLHRVYTPDSAQGADAIARYVCNAAAVQRQVPELRPWIESGIYVTTVLVDERDRAARVEAALYEKKVDGRPLHEIINLHVEVVPGQSTLKGALDALA